MEKIEYKKVEQLNTGKVTLIILNIDKLEEVNEIVGRDEQIKKVQNGIVSDLTGQVKMSFWDEHAGKFQEGDKIKLIDGWCKEYEGDLQLSPGKFGRISLVPPEKIEDN